MSRSKQRSTEVEMLFAANDEAPTAEAAGSPGKLRIQDLEGLIAILSKETIGQNLEFHRIQLLAATLHQYVPWPIPEKHLLLCKVQIMRVNAVVAQLAQLAEVIDQPLILLKGADLAFRYPFPNARPLGDIDILLEDPLDAFHRLKDSGYHGAAASSLPNDYHHLPVLVPHTKGLRVPVELHRSLGMFPWINQPSVQQCFDSSVDSPLRIPNVRSLSPEFNTVYVAAHAWRHSPLSRMGYLVDVASALLSTEPESAGRMAAEWNMSHIWRQTYSAMQYLVRGQGSRPLSVATWARHLTTLEPRSHDVDQLTRLFSGAGAPGLAAKLAWPKELVGRRRLALSRHPTAARQRNQG